MASTKSPTVKNLEALGAARLAELLVEIGSANPAVRRRLRLALAGEAGAAEVAREVQKRLSTLAKARSFIEWNKIKPLADDLAAQHRAIVDIVAKTDPRQGLDLLWRFMQLVEPVMQRCDDSNGQVGDVFRAAADDLAPLAMAAEVGHEELARDVFDAVRGNGYGQFDDLIPRMASALDADGLASLKRRLVSWGQEPPAPQGERKIVGYGPGGPLYADEAEARHREWTIRSALQEIADLEGDVDGYIAQIPDETRRVPGIAADIARRLLKAARPQEAWRVIEAVDRQRLGAGAAAWRQTRLDALEALGRTEEAQTFRWACFAETLRPEYLRAYLKALPDFDDVEAEDRAVAFVLGFPDIHRAIAFLIAWPALDRASELVLARCNELNGDLYELLAPAGEALEARYPLASTLLRRAMIDFTLTAARAKRYRHAARHLAECDALAMRIDDFGAHPSHAEYRRRLQSEHGRKAAFWQSVQDLG